MNLQINGLLIKVILSPNRLQTLKLGRIVYYGLHLKLFDHYLCFEYFAKVKFY